MLDSSRWLRWFLIEVLDSSNIVDGNNSLLIGIFYISTIGESIEENLHASYAY